MITALDHIAIAVPDLNKAIKRFMDDFGIEFKGTEEVERAKTTTAFFPIEGTQIELVHPIREGEGPVAKYLEKKGGGLHHICFSTDDILADVEMLKAKGYQFLSDAPTIGAHDCQVIFIHPKSSDGVLIELSQPPANH
ncbi:methylmalonyl-CoA epimerase [Sinobacterium caligoides]|uniref:Methylmalonyl-CoA epimerase n=1 Tax=Sinobacterium caligoides TaxID=933926 RepID=A0A3N2DXL5_9GAMM|nr:methylmalonyl-CoA epimerase [Sinobacterium caligoides]ROS04600.1 methylmalonyl-CoA epimerase [Sinobacterium caligoides]